MKRRMKIFLKELHADTHDCVECENLKNDNEEFETAFETWQKNQEKTTNDEQSKD